MATRFVLREIAHVHMRTQDQMHREKAGLKRKEEVFRVFQARMF